ncbi:TonB-dependent receptor [Gilvimarinus agarilyticus]|uniref:TonB-dependent receptor domain-containing protein n=1 Tax=Gilvimarinus sp. 2_MG-2023 TaxID=3062666 RepID=UPI001C0947AE|nr:TonB-dependent receptor [Gilvimarinus sp. 2_MG-2023]MBU2887747.1 TonB-dependent receptor [Gilvimarinus agarilyticus]MDO6572395.1 TonB-dependent receptor [Gilvimarinus sp. 2_MG-2023]
MSTNNRFKLTALTAAVLAAHSIHTFAQDSSNPAETDILEEVVVTGIRGALQQSIDDKRDAQQIMDTINAEDMGKNTDQNIADALGRVTGVSIVTRNGEGAQVTVRGASANQNNISLNGQQLTSTDFSQAVDLSSYSSDILSKLEVFKTPSADHDEGSLGASINLVTVRPLDQAEDVRSLTLQGRYNDYSEEDNYKIQFSASDTFLDDTLGVAVTLFDETNTWRRDQYRVEDFEASRTIDVARDQHGEIISGARGIQHTSTFFEQNTNTNDRTGGTLGIQWAPTDRTEVMFNGTYTAQEETRQLDAFKTRRANNNNFVEGLESISSNYRPAAPFTDPQQDWYTIDTDTNTFTKNINRFGIGDVLSSVGGDDKENASATLDFSHEFTDTFRAAAKIGYSKSTADSLPNAYAVMQNFVEVPVQVLWDAGENIQPTGYDCTSGKCNLVYGDSFIDLGDQIESTAEVPGYEDNIGYTGYNPADITSQNVGYLSEDEVHVTDELKNAQIDFDWDIDTLGVTTLEFGAKVTEREKFVDNQDFNFSSVTKTEAVFDEDGIPVVIPGGALRDVRAESVARDGLDYDDFMGSLGYYTGGANDWIPVDGLAAKNLVLDDENTVRTPDRTETRTTNIDTSALYLKANFSYFDDRLTGDIGVRYVETEIEATGFGGIDFWQHDETLQREFDLVHLRDLRDTSLPECRAPIFSDPTGDGLGYENKFQRVDGTGWDTSSGPDPSGWTAIPDQGPCHDPRYAAWADYQQNGGTDPEQELGWYTMWRYADVSTLRDGGFVQNGANPGVTYDPSVAIDGPDANAHEFVNTTNNELKSFASENSHSYDNILPSLNLNYAITDDLVGRFAISKTMTRPAIDNLRSGFSINESGYWAAGQNVGTFRQFNTKLEPLESKNIDVSLEWYFNDTGMISAAIFNKDMSNFTDTESALVYMTDLRELEGTVNPEDLVVDTWGTGDDSALGSCMPLRATADYGWQQGDPNRFSDDLRDLCGVYSASKLYNGKGASITGVELGYTQTYDFLPGYFLSGLGVQANYTYQDSEYDQQYSTFNPDELLPAYPVADTPEHTYNLTAFWEQDGHQFRVSYRGSSDSLMGTDTNTGLQGRTWNQGSLWNEGRDQVDLSATYSISENIDLTFQAINLTDAAFRSYFTNRELEVTRVNDPDSATGYSFVAVDEGNPLDGNATKSRTYAEYKTGITYRLGLRARF